MKKRFIYADNAATTKISKSVLDAMLPYLNENYGNASSIYMLGQDCAKDLLEARKRVAKTINAKESEIYFTSGGSESDNWAIKGVAISSAKKGKKHIITSAIEHHAVLHTCQFLEEQGFEVTYLPVDENGLVSVNDLKNAIREDTCLVSIMYANNEIGTIEPIAEIGKVCKEKKVPFHTDAVQAIGSVKIDVIEQNIDMLSISGHKIHAPKGIGALYVRNGLSIPNLIHGGGQERGKRAGTENLASIIAFTKAIEEATENIDKKIAYITPLRDKLIEELTKISQSKLNGDRVKRLCGNVNISFRGIEGEGLLLYLDNEGICASSGSACTSGSLDPSHVLLAIGLTHEVAHGSLRLSINEDTTEDDIDYIIEKVRLVVKKIREMSPLWETISKNENIKDII